MHTDLQQAHRSQFVTRNRDANRSSTTDGQPLHPSQRRDALFFLYADGGARGNPGVAGVGAAIFDATSGALVAELYRFIGDYETNNVAEYTAVIEGLRLAQTLRVRRLEIRSDSQLLVKQLCREYKVRHPRLRELYQQVESLMVSSDFDGGVKVVHVPREMNKVADALANRAMDERSSNVRLYVDVGSWEDSF